MHGTPLFLFPPYRPSSSDCANGAMRENRPHHRFTPTAQCGKTALIIGLRQRRDAGKPPSSSVYANGAMRGNRPHHRFAPTARCEKNRRRAVSYVSTGLACLPRDTNASPIYRRRAVVYVNTSLGLHSLVAERRHSSVTRYAKRSVACRDSPRHQPLRAGGTPLPHLRRLPRPSSTIIIRLRIHIVRHPSICASEMRSCADRASGHAFS